MTRKQDFKDIAKYLDDIIHLSNRYINSNISNNASGRRFSQSELQVLPGADECPYITDSLAMAEDNAFVEGLDGVLLRASKSKKALLGIEYDADGLENYSEGTRNNFISILETTPLVTVGGRCNRSKSVYIPDTQGGYLDSTVVAGSYISKKLDSDKKILSAIKSKAKVHAISHGTISVGGEKPQNVSAAASKRLVQNNVLVFNVPNVFYSGDVKGQAVFRAYQEAKRSEFREPFFKIPISVFDDYKAAVGSLDHEWNRSIKKIEAASANIIRIIKHQRNKWKKELDSAGDFDGNNLTSVNKSLYHWDEDGLVDYLFSRVTNGKVGVGKNLGDKIDEQLRRSFSIALKGV